MEKVVRVKQGKVYLRETDTKRVEPIGSKNADIAIVGEAPGREEENKGKPFVGKSGRLLNQLLSGVGIDRYDCYITNVLKVRPPKNDIKYYYDGKSPSQDLQQAREDVKEELREVQPNVVIALGQEALRTLLGDDSLRISNWRGSIVDTEFGKVIPTYHPAYVLRMWKYKSIMQFDLHRAFNESHTRDFERKERTLLINPSLREVRSFMEECKESEYLSFDIETKKTSEWFIDHVGIAISPDYAMSIPFWKDGKHYWSVEDEIEVWKLLAEVLGDKSIKKIAQNAPYDTIFLEEHHIPIYNLWMDTMVAVKLVYPEFSKSLQFIASIYTREPYYKDTNEDERSIYNAKDCTVTYEGAFAILEDLEELGMKDFYFDHVHPLIPIYIEVQQFGVRIDHDKIEKVQEQVENDIKELRAKLKELTGKDINVYSVKDMRGYIYGDLKLKKKYNDNGNLDTCKQVLNDFYRNTGREEFKIMIELRKSRSRSSTYLSAETDEDGRMRTSYDVSGTETGRLSSKKDVHGRGMNLQNVQHGVFREMFIPDEGMKFLGADLSQAENRVVAYVSGDENMIDVVESEGDIHKQNAAMIFEKDPKNITHDERQLGKRITHASNYVMGAITFARFAKVSTRKARELLKKYKQTYPKVDVWHKDIEKKVRKTREMTNPFGRKKVFHGRMGSRLFRNATAFEPQSTIADTLHRATRNIYARLPHPARIVLQLHDAITVQAPESDLEKVSPIIKQELERPFEIRDTEIVIPTEVLTGDNWEEVS